MTTKTVGHLKRWIESVAELQSVDSYGFKKLLKVADFGGTRTRRIVAPMLKNVSVLKYDVFDIKGDAKDTLLVDLTIPFDVFERDSVYDFIICTDTLEHTKKPWEVVSNIETALKPGGYAFVSAPFKWKLHGEDYFRFTREGLYTMFKKAILVESMYLDEEENGVESVIVIKKEYDC